MRVLTSGGAALHGISRWRANPADRPGSVVPNLPPHCGSLADQRRHAEKDKRDKDKKINCHPDPAKQAGWPELQTDQGRTYSHARK